MSGEVGRLGDRVKALLPFSDDFCLMLAVCLLFFIFFELHVSADRYKKYEFNTAVRDSSDSCLVLRDRPGSSGLQERRALPEKRLAWHQLFMRRRLPELFMK